MNPEIEVDGTIIINGKAYPAIKLLEVLNKLGALSFDVENAQLILNGDPITPLSTRKKALSLLCYHSLAHCCPIEGSCEKRDIALKMLDILPEEYSRIKEEHHLQFLELEPSHSPSPYSETSPSRTTDDVDLSSFFGTPNDDALASEKENTDDFLKEVIGNNWDQEIRYGRKNVPPSTETSLRHLNYSGRCPRCKKHNSPEDKYCFRCGTELRD